MNDYVARWRDFKPKTPDDVDTLIREFREVYPNSEWNFAHIVISDYNINRDDIEWCLEPEQVDEWFNGKLAEITKLYPEESNPNGKEQWERYRYDELIELRDATKQFLELLLTFPDGVLQTDYE